MKQGVDDIFLVIECVRGPSRSQSKQDLLAHVDIQAYQVRAVRKEFSEDRKPPAM
jgi:hypothetical protein